MKRQMSWHDDFTRNFSRFFSGSKSVDRNESDVSRTAADASLVTCSSHRDPEQHLDTVTSAQELQCSDVLDRNSESHAKDSMQGGAGGSALEPPPLNAPAPQPSSTAPPVEGFFRRLSLFLFSQAEPAGVQRDRQTDTDSSHLITRDSQTRTDTQKTGGGVELSQQTLDLSECHSEVTHTQSEEQSEECSSAVDINSAKELLEEKRRYDLACPPVVTYGRYRGLREVRRQKRKRHMELHSPVSEGDEATHPDEETGLSPTTGNPFSHTPSCIQPIESALTPSALPTETGDKSGQTPANRLLNINETDSDQLVISIGDSVHRIHKAEQSPLKKSSNSEQEKPHSETLDTGSVDMQSKPLLFCTDAHCHTQLSDMNIDRHSLFPATEQSSELEKLSVSADTEEHSAPDDPQSWNIVDRRSELKLSEGDSGKDEEVRLESVKMVENILENAFAALQRMEVSDPESEDLLTCELTEGSERVLFDGADGGGNAEQQFSGTPSLGLEEGLTGGRSHADGCRSTPSSGYESIAGSDTDIRCCVGVASEITTTNVPISSQHEEHDTNQTVLEYIADERDVSGSASCGRDVLLNCAADEESDNLHIIQRKDIRLALPACSESRSRENHMINVSVNTMERDGQGNRSQDTSKDNTMSIDCRYNLNGDDCTVDTDTSVHQENQSQSLGVMAESEPFNYSLATDKTQSEMRDRAQISEVVQQLPAAQRRNSETLAAHSYSAEQDRLFCGSEPEIDVRFLLVDSFLPSETEVQSDEPVHSAGLDPSHWTSVGAFSCDVTDDQSGSETLKKDLESELSVDRAESRTSAVCLSGKRIHLDSIPQHSRPHEPEQVDGGFASISEEEEMDSVFVNDTGPMYSPSTRRAKTYPFSLSPIYEESVCEEASGQEMMQVPPATEEEQKQPALSILTLLQSVSEKLQSSVMCDSDEGCTESLRAEPRPLWDRYREDCEDDNDNFSILLHQQLTEETPVHVPNTENEPSSDIEPMANEAKDRLQEEQNCDGMLGNVGENANMPFYQYLTSSVMPSADKEAKHSSAVCHSENNTALTGQIGGFGKFSPRPSIMFIYEGQSLSAERREVFADVEDAEKVLFPHGSLVHAVRGCWLLYADSWFRGSCVLLEEGQTVRTTGEPQQNLEELREPNRTSHTDIQSVGSIRTLHKDDSVPEIHLNMSQTRDTVRVFSATDVMEEFGPLFLSDVCVKTGCWLAYEKPGFSGNSAVLEMEGRVTPVLQNSLLSCVKSLRPLKMGGLKVMRPLDPKVILYEKVKFQGKYRELLDHAASLRATEGPVDVSSIRVMGGIWVCFSREGFRGHQRVLEEGQYSNCTQLFSGTQCTIKSLRYIQTEFLEPSVCLRSSDEEINVLDLDVPDLQLKEVESICVTRGAWVAYSKRGFTGDQHVLEKGQYPGGLEWGGGQSWPGSLRPIRREVCGIVEPKFLICVYTQPHYGGECREFVGEAPDCRVPEFISFRVIRGSWLLFDEEGYSGNQYILGEGLYPDLTSCGCVSPKSLKPIPYSFTDPSVSLFSLSGFEGLEETLFSEMENMRQFFSQSLRVNGGLWVAYEYSHFKGHQMLLQPGEYPDWGEHSGWDTIGSLKSLKQPKVHIQVRNRALDSVLTTENVLEGSFPAKLFLSPADCSLNTQCWIFTDGLLKNTVQRGCVSVIGAKACVGARVALWEEHGRMNQRWSLNGDGTISSHLNHSLVLDLKGGSGTDRDHVILSQLSAHKATQTWDVDVL